MKETTFDAKTQESEIYEMWEKSGCFNPDNCKVKKSAKPFTIIMPPPNANGALHVGHATFVTLQDILIRFWRMRGKRTLWLPGADHAGFETQVVFDKKLEKEGRSRFDMPRETLWQEIFAFTQKNKAVMEHQLRKLGSSCDWSREKFTLDEDVIATVSNTFKKLYNDGLAYRGNRIVHWCPKHQTSFSDLEVLSVERVDPFYYLKYGPFVIGTARPETKFGDKYVVVHPKDARYKKYRHGETFSCEWMNGPVTATIIKDATIDMKFGTGAMTITPWHDATDFEIAERHGLDKEQVIDERGKLLPIAGEFAGMKILEAREKIIEKLQSKGLVARVDTAYMHTVRVCYKCNTLIEPQIKIQWFVKMAPLAKKAIAAVKTKKIKFFPERAKKVYSHWLMNIRDWNISRQIVWGIRIPAWYCKNQSCPPIISSSKPSCCETCTSTALTQDTDIFDTWFSSAQWPFVTLGFPNSKDFKTFYPTTVMETGYDILFFWVARMIMMGLYCTKKVQFQNVYLHGLVRDKDRQKMSKSKGNVIDPLGVVELYGADALRMALVVGSTAGNDVVISEEKIRGYRNFATKIWNVARFVSTYPPHPSLKKPHFSLQDKKNIAEIKKIKAQVAHNLEHFKFHLAAETTYHYVWHTFADKIIESVKPRLKDSARVEEYHAAAHMIRLILQESLIMLHPFMPFVTEALYQEITHDGTLLVTTSWETRSSQK